MSSQLHDGKLGDVMKYKIQSWITMDHQDIVWARICQYFVVIDEHAVAAGLQCPTNNVMSCFNMDMSIKPI